MLYKDNLARHTSYMYPSWRRNEALTNEYGALLSGVSQGGSSVGGGQVPGIRQPPSLQITILPPFYLAISNCLKCLRMPLRVPLLKQTTCQNSKADLVRQAIISKHTTIGTLVAQIISIRYISHVISICYPRAVLMWWVTSQSRLCGLHSTVNAYTAVLAVGFSRYHH